MASEPKAIVTQKKKIPAIWFVPLIALIIGIWMVVDHFLSQGPEITITFSTAEGIEAGKTKVKLLNVNVGAVESVGLHPGHGNQRYVLITARMNKEIAHLLRSDSRFWVVRPRIGAGGVSGLGTLFSGAYIEFAPGEGKEGKREFKGLDNIPATPQIVPGLRLNLVSDVADSVSTGDPVLFHGYQVGRVESAKLDADKRKLHAKIFIEAPYDTLVNSHTRFWNRSGITFEATAEGITLQTGSLQSMLIGGIEFDLPEGATPGGPVENNAEFELYPNKHSINQNPYEHYHEFILLFDSSVKGLVEGAHVYYRGIRIGTVMDVSFNYVDVEMTRTNGRAPKIPVLIRIEPGRWLGRDSKEAKELGVKAMAKSVEAGMRATIQTGNLLTGAKVIAFDFHEDVEPATLGKVGNYDSVPTVSTGLEEIQIKVANLLDKLNALPYASVMQDADQTLKQMTKTLADADQAIKELNEILHNKDTKEIPKSVNETLIELQSLLEGMSPDSEFYQNLNDSIAQLNDTLRNIEHLTYTVDTKPSSIIFSKPKQQDIQPEAPN